MPRRWPKLEAAPQYSQGSCSKQSTKEHKGTTFNETSSDSDDDELEDSQVMVRSNTRIGSMLVANKAAGGHWQSVRADSFAIAQIMRLRDVADELIAAAETEQLTAAAEKAAMENDESAASILVRNRREVSVCKSEPEGETYYMDNKTGETTWELPDDAFITEGEESTLDLGQAPHTLDDPPCEDVPQRRLHQFSVSVTEGGDEYFIKNETQETAWDPPKTVKLWRFERPCPILS